MRNKMPLRSKDMPLDCIRMGTWELDIFLIKDQVTNQNPTFAASVMRGWEIIMI